MKSDETLREWLENIKIYGFSFIDGVPPTTEATRYLAERISFMKQTFYGSLWEFGSFEESKELTKEPLKLFNDMAYESVALRYHTDTSYFSEPIGLQLLHLLKQTGTGGLSKFVDGFYVAKLLQQQNPEAYKILSTIPVPSIYLGDKEYYSPEPMPILRHSLINGELYQIRYNNEDRDMMSYLKDNQMETFYHAYHQFNLMLQDPQNEYVFQLIPGKPVIFDNWRLLHGRSAIYGHRHMAGCYIGHDEWTSQLRYLRHKRI